MRPDEQGEPVCKSITDGGQRCAAHTRPVFERTGLDDPRWPEAAANYASTRAGREAITEMAHEAALVSDFQYEAMLLTAVRHGDTKRQVGQDVKVRLAQRLLGEHQLVAQVTTPNTVRLTDDTDSSAHPTTRPGDSRTLSTEVGADDCIASEHELVEITPADSGFVSWTQNGVRRPDLYGSKSWTLNGSYHRLDGPAYISRDGDEEWFRKGLRHRVGGPAFTRSDGTQEWRVDDIDVTPIATLLPDLTEQLGEDVVVCAHANQDAITRAAAHRDPARLRHDLGLRLTGAPTPEHVAAWHLITAP